MCSRKPNYHNTKKVKSLNFYGFSMASNTATSRRLPSPHPRSVARRARHLAKAPSRHHLSDSEKHGEGNTSCETHHVGCD